MDEEGTEFGSGGVEAVLTKHFPLTLPISNPVI